MGRGEPRMGGELGPGGPGGRAPAAQDLGFGSYDPATETYTPATLTTGQPAGHPSDAFDTAAIVHLTDHRQ